MARNNVDLDGLLDSNAKVYVRNNAVKSHLLIIVQMEDRAGRKRALKVPPTQFPICISTQFSKDMIRESSDLRDALAKGVLVLVDPKEAEASLQSPEANEELKSYALSVYADNAPDNAVRDNIARLRGETANAGTGGDVEMGGGDETGPVTTAASVIAGAANLPTDEVTPRVQALISSLVNKEKSSKDTLVQLKRLKSTLGASDLTYIVRECANETQVREWAEGALAEVSGS